MSINIDDSHRSIDYSDFEFQHVDMSIGYTNGEEVGTQGNATGYVEVDPLETSGGLETHEVAELVGLYREVMIEPDGYDPAPTTQGNVEFRGAFGVDLNSESDLVFGTSSAKNELDTSGTVLDEENAVEAQLGARGHDKNEVLDHFQLNCSLQFDNASGSAGDSLYLSQRDIQFREHYGAGPIVDSGDSMSTVMRLVVNNQEIEQLSGHYRTTLVWDIAEVEDAGRRFGIPQ